VTSVTANPAGRLQTFFESLQALERGGATFIQDAMLVEAGLKPGEQDFVPVFRMLSAIMPLPNRIDALIRADDRPAVFPDLLLKYVGNWISALAAATVMTNPIGRLTHFLTEPAMSHLEMCAHTLAVTEPKDPSVEVLEELRRGIVELMAAIDESEVEPPLRDLLLRYLRDLQDTLALYRFTGPEAVQAKLDQLNGAVERLAPMGSEARSRWQAFWERYDTWMARAAAAVTVGSAALPVIGAAASQLAITAGQPHA